MKKFDPTLNTVFTDDGKPVIAPMGQPSGARSSNQSART